MLTRSRTVYLLVAAASLMVASYQPADVVASSAGALANSIDRVTRLAAAAPNDRVDSRDSSLALR